MAIFVRRTPLYLLPLSTLLSSLFLLIYFSLFEERVESFQPDLLALSATEDMFLLGIKLLKCVRQYNILTIAGGVFPTFGPEIALRFPEIDIVCVGEGENALVELCQRIEKKKHFDDIFLKIEISTGSLLYLLTGIFST